MLGAINLPDEAMQAQRLLDDSFYVEEDTPYLYTSVWSASVKFGRTTLCIQLGALLPDDHPHPIHLEHSRIASHNRRVHVEAATLAMRHCFFTIAFTIDVLLCALTTFTR
jgi:hypothetical protein